MHCPLIKVYHAVRVNSQWRPYKEGYHANKCVAIKVSGQSEEAKAYLKQEAVVLGKIWNNLGRPQHIIRLLEV
jgi:hypothetical protein